MKHKTTTTTTYNEIQNNVEYLFQTLFFYQLYNDFNDFRNACFVNTFNLLIYMFQFDFNNLIQLNMCCFNTFCYD